LEIFSDSWWLISLAVFVAAFIRGALGFAFALLLSPFLLLLLSPKQVVVTDISLSIISNAFNIFMMMRTFERNIKPRILLVLMIGCLLGMPFGAYVLSIINASLFKIFIGSIIIIFALLLFFGIAIFLKRYAIVSIISGFLSGFLTTSTSLGGPPVVFFLHGQMLSKEAIYCTQVVYWLYMLIFSLLILLIGGVIHINMIYASLSFVPPLILGMTVGIQTFWFLNNQIFRTLTLCIIMLSGMMAILSGIRDFL
jgi:hypothetical protein